MFLHDSKLLKLSSLSPISNTNIHQPFYLYSNYDLNLSFPFLSLLHYYTALFHHQQQRQVQMNMRHHKITSSNSIQNLGQYYYQPLSPYNKISTPLRTRINTSTPIAHNTSINFASAISNSRSPIGKENTGNLHNQSPILNKFNTEFGCFAGDQSTVVARMMNKKKGKLTHYNHHQSNAIEPNQQYYDEQPKNFEEGLKSLAVRSPQNKLQNKTKMALTKSPHNFKGILEEYEIKRRDGQEKKKGVPSLKKSFSSSQYNIKLFNSGPDSSDTKLNSDQFKREIPCMNEDGNRAKYMTIVRQDNEQRLYYCSKCTVLLVGQGFILQEIINSQQADSQDDIEEQTKIQECKDKLKSLINDLQMRQSFETRRLNDYYEGLCNILSYCKNENEETLKKIYTQKIQEYEELLKQLESFDLNANYQNRHPQLDSYYQSIQGLKLGQQVMRKYQDEDLKNLQQSLQQYARHNIQLNLDQQQNLSSRQAEVIQNRNNGLRFSFQRLLNDINSKKTKMQNYINTLEEEQQEESDYIQNCLEENRKTAFRDLFPEAEDHHQASCSINSPTFKHF